MRTDQRYVAELPSGIVKNPQLHIAGTDLWPNDVVWLDGDTVYPMYDESHDMYGVVTGCKMKPMGWKYTLIAA